MITQSRDDSLVTLTIDHAEKANSLTPDMLDALIDAFATASADESVRGVLLNAAGDKGFSAGMNTAQFEHKNSTRAYDTISRLGRVCEAIKDCAVPVSVAIQGYCIGGALEVAAAADFRVATTDSWYSMPEVRIGIPSVLESVNLYRLMGGTKASEIILTGNRFSASDMDKCGFLNAVVDKADLHATAIGYLNDCAQSDRDVIAQQKRLFSTWKNTSEQVAIVDSKKEFSLAFARRND